MVILTLHSLVRDYSQFSRVTEYTQSNQGLCIVKSWAMQSPVSLLAIHSLVRLPSMHSLVRDYAKFSQFADYAQFSHVTEYAQLCKLPLSALHARESSRFCGMR